MKGYKRLTVKRADGKPTVRSITKQGLINRLAKLEDEIENGTLVELPCKCIEELDIIKDGMLFTFYKMCLEQNLGQGVFLEYKSKINEWFKNYLKNKGLQEKELPDRYEVGNT